MKPRKIHLILFASALVAAAGTLSSCANAIPENHSLAPSQKIEEQGNFYDAAASSELTKIKNIIDDRLLEHGEDYVTAGVSTKKLYASHEGIEWSYTANDDNSGYLLKVWTPAGGTFNTEHNAMSIESVNSAPDDHSNETPEEHASHMQTDSALPAKDDHLGEITEDEATR